MIERLRLQHWRAFEDVELELGAGTTFIVAPNGVGKTSLLLGVTWAIFGDTPSVKPQDCVRVGAATAEAEVRLRLSDHRALDIFRSVSTAGISQVRYEVDGTQVDAGDAVRVMETEYGVKLDLAARLAMMVGGGHVASQRALELEGHLYEAFGVAGLRDAAKAASELAKLATKGRSVARAAVRQGAAERVQLEVSLASAEQVLELLRVDRLEIAEALAHLDLARALETEWARHDSAAERRRAAIAETVEVAADLLRRPASNDSLIAELEQDLTDTRLAIAAATEAITEARAQSLATRSALELLRAEDPSCPTCLRPFHGHELGNAISSHEQRLRSSEAAEMHPREAREVEEQRLARLQKLRESTLQWPEATPEPHLPRPEAGTADRHAVQAAALSAHDEKVGHARARHGELQRQLALDEEAQADEVAQRAAYLEEALALAAADALTSAADQLTREFIEPLGAEIRKRWKSLFGEGGLQLRADGSIVRVVDDRELPWESLSGGERIWARLITHVLVLSASTRLPFAWFDEPLEHLDPRARRAVATALAHATRAGGPTQLIVTTYEHALARQLAEDTPEATIKYIRPTPWNR